MEFKLNKISKPILRPASKLEKKSDENNSNQPTQTIAIDETTKFIDIKICQKCFLIFKDDSRLNIHSNNH